MEDFDSCIFRWDYLADENCKIKEEPYWPSHHATPFEILKPGDKVCADRAFWRCKDISYLIMPSNTNSPTKEEANWSRKVCAVRYLIYLRKSILSKLSRF